MAHAKLVHRRGARVIADREKAQVRVLAKQVDVTAGLVVLFDTHDNDIRRRRVDSIPKDGILVARTNEGYVILAAERFIQNVAKDRRHRPQ